MLRGTQALRRCAWQLPVRTSQRCLSSASPEAQLEDKLRGSLRGVQHVKVKDTSGGCGTMYDVAVTAEEFRGKSVVKQHQLVTKALSDNIKQWHGFTLNTAAPS